MCVCVRERDMLLQKKQNCDNEAAVDFELQFLNFSVQ